LTILFIGDKKNFGNNFNAFLKRTFLYFIRFGEEIRSEIWVSETDLEGGAYVDVVAFIDHIIAVFLDPKARLEAKEALFIGEITQFEPFYKKLKKIHKKREFAKKCSIFVLKIRNLPYIIRIIVA